MTKIKFIIMSCGYVESNYTSNLIYGTHFHGHKGFDTGEEAVKELALDLYAKFFDEYLSTYNNRYGSDYKKCCRDVLDKDKAAKFCSACGTRLEDQQFDGDRFMDFICNLHGSTCDSYGESEYANDRHFIWWPWGLNKFLDADRKSILAIPEQAEGILLDALQEAKPELFVGQEPSDDRYAESSWEKIKAGKSLITW
jgi:hypothetical protein